MYRVTELSPGLQFGLHNNNLVNLIRGIRERVYAVERNGALEPPPRPAYRVVEETLSRFRRLMRKHVVVTTPWDTEKFVSTYVGRRATVYAQAVESLRNRPVHQADAMSSSFLKAEKIPFYLKNDPAPRLIHPRSPRYNVEVGVFVKQIEHQVYRAIDLVWGNKTVLKGYNARQVGGIMAGKWGRFKDPVAIGLDASRFDQHVSTDCLIFEHSCYEMWFSGHDRERLRELLSWQLDTRCVARCSDGRVKYRVRGMRFSGDMNTGVGNCLLMCAMVHAYCEHRGVHAELANNGDDCVLVLERSELQQLDLGLLPRWFRRLGFTMKVEQPVYDLEKVEFCQSHPVCVDGQWLMVRKHRHATAKDCISIKPLDHPRVYDSWRKSVGLAGLSLTGGVPVQQAFYQAFMRGAKGRELKGDPTLETGFMRFARGMDRVAQPVAASTRYSYWLAFGVLPDEQVALEETYSQVVPTYNQAVAMNFVPSKIAYQL